MREEQPARAGGKGAAARMSRGWSLNTFRQGAEAAKSGLPVSANPYEEGSDQAVIWHGGWLAGTSI